ncbi:MAG TPA: GNAT family N-acetyltransferase [Ignavibacteriaceae bacterium]
MHSEKHGKSHSEIVKRLKKDSIRNSSIIGFIKDYPPAMTLSEGDSILVKGKSDREWIYFSSESEAEFNRLFSKLNQEDLCFASVEGWMIPKIIMNRTVDWKLEAFRYYLPEKIVLLENKIKIDSLQESDAEFIVANSNYKQFIEIEYVRDRINKSVSAGVIVNGHLAAWAITHDDGAIGALHVVDEYRNQGFAAEIVINLSQRIRKEGSVPIAQIEEKNIPATKLFNKIGFVKDRKVSWIKLKD